MSAESEWKRLLPQRLSLSTSWQVHQNAYTAQRKLRREAALERKVKSAERTAAELRAELDALHQRVTELTGQLSESLQINNALIARLEITGKSLENANKQLAQVVINSVRSK